MTRGARISLEQVRHIAQLSRLALSEGELEQLTRQLGAILEYVDALKRVNVEGVEGTSHAVPLALALRADEPIAAAVREEVLAAAPQQEEGLFAVPKIVENG